MKRVITVAGVLVALATGSVPHGQSPQQASRRLVGRTVGGGFGWDGKAETDTITVTFPAVDDSPVYTVDFVTRFVGELGQRPTTPPAVVDIIVTQRSVADEAPAMAMRIDGQDLPLASRLHGQRSLAATIPFDQFVGLASAQTIVEHAFDTDLEFSPGTLQVFRGRLADWAERVRR
jgi:hypothetical protein